MFRAHVLIIRRSKLHYTASGIITPVGGRPATYRCDDTVRMVHGTIRTVHSSSQDHHPSKNSVHKTICCNSTSNTPDDGRMYLKHVELRIHQ